MSKAFAGKLAVVTGASKANGVGYATAYALAEQGANVSAVYTVLHVSLPCCLHTFQHSLLVRHNPATFRCWMRSVDRLC
jgi:NAD(P)-dependent dehydrogenase (short-subunit alcohol dehydrogenase family)